MQTSHAKCFRAKIFDRFHQGMSRRHVFRIPLQNSEFQFTCNIQFLVVCFYLHSDIGKYPALSCLVWTKKKNVHRETGNGKAFAGSKRYVNIFVNCKYVEC